MKRVYRWFKKLVGVIAYLYWIPFFYGIKHIETLGNWNVWISLAILLCVGISLSAGFLGMCKYDKAPEESMQDLEVYVEGVPEDSNIMNGLLLQSLVGVSVNTPTQLCLITGVLFLFLLGINCWIYNPVFLLFGFRFYNIRTNGDVQFMMPVQLRDNHRKIQVNGDRFRICTYGGSLDWMAFRKS